MGDNVKNNAFSYIANILNFNGCKNAKKDEIEKLIFEGHNSISDAYTSIKDKYQLNNETLVQLQTALTVIDESKNEYLEFPELYDVDYTSKIKALEEKKEDKTAINNTKEYPTGWSVDTSGNSPVYTDEQGNTYHKKDAKTIEKLIGSDYSVVGDQIIELSNGKVVGKTNKNSDGSTSYYLQFSNKKTNLNSTSSNKSSLTNISEYPTGWSAETSGNSTVYKDEEGNTYHKKQADTVENLIGSTYSIDDSGNIIEISSGKIVGKTNKNTDGSTSYYLQFNSKSSASISQGLSNKSSLTNISEYPTGWSAETSGNSTVYKDEEGNTYHKKRPDTMKDFIGSLYSIDDSGNIIEISSGNIVGKTNTNSDGTISYYLKFNSKTTTSTQSQTQNTDTQTTTDESIDDNSEPQDENPKNTETVDNPNKMNFTFSDGKQITLKVVDGEIQSLIYNQSTIKDSNEIIKYILEAMNSDNYNGEFDNVNIEKYIQNNESDTQETEDLKSYAKSLNKNDTFKDYTYNENDYPINDYIENDNSENQKLINILKAFNEGDLSKEAALACLNKIFNGDTNKLIDAFRQNNLIKKNIQVAYIETLFDLLRQLQ